MEDTKDSGVSKSLPGEGLAEHRIPPPNILQSIRKIAEIASLAAALPLPCPFSPNRMPTETRLFSNLSLPLPTVTAVLGA